MDLSRGRPGEATAEFRVGVGPVPYLADHGVADMLILPGSYFVEMARRVDRELCGRAPDRVRNVVFDRPVILGSGDTGLRAEVKEIGDGRAEYVFFEGGRKTEENGARGPQHVARLEVDRHASTPSCTGPSAVAIDAFQTKSDAVIESDRFYAALRSNGNHFGPAFQRVSSIWRAGEESLGKLSASPRDTEAQPCGLHPSVLDAVTQVLAFFLVDDARTFILRSIETVEIADAEISGTLWAHAERRRDHTDSGGAGLVGDVRVFDAEGNVKLTLSGVVFSSLDRSGEKEGERFVIASNFTAEPVEDALDFWAHHFGTRARAEFTPYDQVFQQLLDPRSAFRSNRDGVNVVLLGLEEWAEGERRHGMTLDRQRADRCFGGERRHLLPNGLEIAHLNAYETDYLYKEIFEDRAYLKHGIRIENGATVLDIGANIGLFSLFVLSRSTDARIYAYEPAPDAFRLLKANCEAYGDHVHAVNAGVSDRPKTATLTFYENSSVFSGFHADENEDREAIRAVVRNTLSRETSLADDAVEDYVTELTAERLRHRSHECRMTTVSEIIRENGIDGIDLLKIDAEKSELEIVDGIDDGDWAKIRQIVLEVHDPSYETVTHIDRLLKSKGFHCVIEREQLLEQSGLVNLYAIREPNAGADVAHERRTGAGLRQNVDDFCDALGAFMADASSPVVLCVCPRTPAAKADPELDAALDDAERLLLSRAGAMVNVHTIGSDALLERYPLDDYHDQHGHDLGHMPYTPAGYAAIGTAVYRTAFNLGRKPFKAIVLDCDNTLWKGVCGEDGALGVEVSTPYRKLQEFMIDQMKAGMLLCVCSKNNHQDVLEVFDRHPDMVLRPDHILSWRVNWNSKSENLESLAGELDLGLDTFIFIDDEPVECAEVGSNCPEVLTLQLPRDSAALPSFLSHVWAFDHAGVTAEDRKRTRMYRQNADRQRFRGQTRSLKDFIRGLELRVDVGEATDDLIPRISQLTCRTNQFNFSAIRRSEDEIRQFLERDGAGGLVVHVTDRFGDYGLVGAVLYESNSDRYVADTFLLSCRVLGRGVEHAILARLGRRAAEDGRDFVEIVYRPTPKNAPAKAFIDSIDERPAKETDGSFIFAADRLARLEYDPDTATPGGQRSAASGDSISRHDARPRGGDLSAPLRQIAERLFDVPRLMQAIEKRRLGDAGAETRAGGAPGRTLDAALLDIWRRVLGRFRIGMEDNFFDAGGTSLKAVQVIAAIKRELDRNLAIVDLFECPTVKLLSARLCAADGATEAGAGNADALRRGQRRRVARRIQVA